MRKTRTIRLMILCGTLLGAVTTQAVTARKLIQQGNAAYDSGQLEEALSAYDEASVDAPESPEIYYNRGAVFYRQEDYEQAKEAFEKAALKSLEPVLESRARYNLGNCAFREAERQRDSDLQKSFESCEAAIKHYQDAFRRNRDLTKAAENIEIVRLYMKALLDEIEKQKKEQEQQQQQQEDLAQKLKALIDRQAKALAENRQLFARGRQPDAAQQQREIALGMEDLTKEQTSIQSDTGAVSTQVLETINQHTQAAQPSTPGATNQPASDPQQMAQMQEKLGKVKEHVDNAIAQQAEANRKLPLKQLQQAQPNQQASEEELKKALEALQDENQQQQQQSQDQGDEDEKEDQEEGEEEQQQQDQEQQSREGEEEKEQPEQEMQTARAEDILDEEKEQREQRRQRIPMRFRAVDRNW